MPIRNLHNYDIKNAPCTFAPHLDIQMILYPTVFRIRIRFTLDFRIRPNKNQPKITYYKNLIILLQYYNIMYTYNKSIIKF